jgi:hypothetical protein
MDKNDKREGIRRNAQSSDEPEGRNANFARQSGAVGTVFGYGPTVAWRYRRILTIHRGSPLTIVRVFVSLTWLFRVSVLFEKRNQFRLNMFPTKKAFAQSDEGLQSRPRSHRADAGTIAIDSGTFER